MMKIKAYQFIKYNKYTSLEHIEKVFKTGAVLCFDFEDGIVNPLRMDLTTFLKEEARKEFTRLYQLIYDHNQNIPIAIRLNNNKSYEFEKDLATIKGKSFHSIIIPKIEHARDICINKGILEEYNIKYKHLIPTIESKKGLENTGTILQQTNRSDKIAFGHCDYNLDVNAYPFFHQDSWEYWKWMAILISKCENHGTQIINSPYLDLANEEFFCSMLDYLANSKNIICGQFTLSTRQSELCSYREPTENNFKNYLDNKNLVFPDHKFLLENVNNFESNNKAKGLSKCNNKIMSLQEYMAARKMINDNMHTSELCFVGGCFPVQYNIVYEDLFHQKLKRKIEENFKINLKINIIRYERFNQTMEKVEGLASIKKLDLIIFHVRPEPYLRLIKLVYKYIDNNGRQKWSLNLPLFKLLNSESYDILEQGRIFRSNKPQKRSLFHQWLVACNYACGSLIGNKRYALERYYEITKSIIDFCNEINIKCLVLGPNRRSNNISEPYLCKSLDSYLYKKTDKQIYVCGFEKDTSKEMNQDNGIHASQAYHNLIAERLYKTIKNRNLLSNPQCIDQREVKQFG